MVRTTASGKHQGNSEAVWRLLVTVISVSGCLPTTTPPLICPDLEVEPIDLAAEQHTFVISAIEIPREVDDAERLGFDLDGDGGIDNAAGRMLSLLDNIGATANIEALVESGAILHLLSIQATSLESASDVGVTVAHGVDEDGDPTDNFSGLESFSIDDTKGRGTVSGHIEAGRLSARIGTLPIELTYPGVGAPVLLSVEFAHIEAEISDNEIRGRIGGAIVGSEVERVIKPILYDGLISLIEMDCADGVCVPDSRGEALTDLFDEDEDGFVSFLDFANAGVTNSFLFPDLDLFDEHGTLGACDREPDALSIGIGFTAVPAQFELDG